MYEIKTPIGFKTRYGLTVVNQDMQPVKDTVWVDNMVLDSGFSALGQITAFNTLSIGTSNTPVKPTQTGLIRTVSTLPMAGGFLSHAVITKGNDIQSTLSYQLTFKKINFPQSSDTITLSEIGITGVTRAVLIEPLSLDYGQWVSVTIEIITMYAGGKGSFDIPSSASYQGQTIQYAITPFISNPSPNNTTASGYQQDGAFNAYPWSGDPVGFGLLPIQKTDFTQLITIDQPNCRAHVTTQGTATSQINIQGFVIEDRLYGGGFLIQFSPSISLQEDDQLAMTCSFSWAKDLS